MNISEIIPYANNAKKHPSKQIGQIAASIKEFGFNQPIVVDKKNEIIVGHGRYEAAKLLGMTEIPILKLENLTDEQVKAYRLADNKLNESEWDMKLAVDELKELSEEMQTLTGFDLDLLIEPDEKDDIVPENVPPVAKLGDVWALGRHRLLCGDSTDKASVERLMDGEKADMVFTDPPYNIAYKGQGKNTSNEIMGDDVMSDAFDIFLTKVFGNFRDSTKAGGGNYVFHASRTANQFEKALAMNNYEIKNQLIWNKPMSALGWGDYRWKHEPLKRDNVHEYVHPTQKPVELITYALFNSTKDGDIVLDLFLGSGSTLIAAEKTGRICYGAEIDPKYADVIIKRWEDYTGLKAEKI